MENNDSDVNTKCKVKLDVWRFVNYDIRDENKIIFNIRYIHIM